MLNYVSSFATEKQCKDAGFPSSQVLFEVWHIVSYIENWLWTSEAIPIKCKMRAKERTGILDYVSGSGLIAGISNMKSEW